ncbi:unnamed protein product [Meganyctiphanes norvegica]|uniref:Phytanoyl-CoA dioxygenase family protein n=1 Tax=Meganyctiphanes norvegica TaxID=48144 RepID=A0AAV2Q7X7_MEGNR
MTTTQSHDSVFHFNENVVVNEEMKNAYNKNGYVLIKGILSPAEISKLRSACEGSKGVSKHAFGRSDGSMNTRVSLWNHPGDDVTGIMVRTNKIAETMEQLMGGDEIYHYHSKLLMKDAKTGGAFVWHQDYGYWYNYGNLFPDMSSVFIPIDDCRKENGCLQVLKGSHLLGRLDHGSVGEEGKSQMGADMEKVNQAIKQHELVYVEMDAGDALFFHCNLLHTSSQNLSDHRRWVFIVAYNKRSNNPYKEHHHPQYTKLHKVPDSALLSCNEVENLDGKWFMNPMDDQ